MSPCENILTFLRIRPINCDAGLYSVRDNHLIVSIPGSSKKHQYTFDKVFDENCEQSEVYDDCCSPLIDSLINGRDSLLFCYGTSASGKSYTIKGPENNPGLIPRTIKELFNSNLDICTEPFASVINYKDFIINEGVSSYPGILIYISFYEIYNDQIFDLLSEDFLNLPQKPLKIGADKIGNHFIKGLTSVFVSSYEQAYQVYSIGLDNLRRNIQSTSLNSTSSRSHSFFKISLLNFSETNKENSHPKVTHFTIGDLAGSERAKKTNSAGDRIREGGHINNSLFTLSRCLYLTKEKQRNPNGKHFVPFNNSNLTKILKPHIMDKSKISIIININPDLNLFQETLISLTFGQTASQIILAKSPKRALVNLNNISPTSSYCSLNSNQEKMDIIEEISNGHYQNRQEIAEEFNQIMDDLVDEYEERLAEQKVNMDQLMEEKLNIMEDYYESTIKKLKSEWSSQQQEYDKKIENLEAQVKSFQEIPLQVPVTSECRDIDCQTTKAYDSEAEEKMKSLQDHYESYLKQVNSEWMAQIENYHKKYASIEEELEQIKAKYEVHANRPLVEKATNTSLDINHMIEEKVNILNEEHFSELEKLSKKWCRQEEVYEEKIADLEQQLDTFKAANADSDETMNQTITKTQTPFPREVKCQINTSAIVLKEKKGIYNSPSSTAMLYGEYLKACRETDGNSVKKSKKKIKEEKRPKRVQENIMSDTDEFAELLDTTTDSSIQSSRKRQRIAIKPPNPDHYTSDEDFVINGRVLRPRKTARRAIF